jgi:hypothetical protein
MGGGGEDTGATRNTAVDQTTTDLLGRLRTQVGRGTAVFNHSLYPGMSDLTREGVGTLTRAARAGGGGLNDAYGWAQDTVESGGYNPALRNAQGSYQNMVNSGGYNPALRTAQNAYQGTINSGGYNPALRSAQSGVQQYLRESQADAPGYAALRAKAGQDTLRDINALTTASGRFGSGSHIGKATEELGNVYAGMDMQNYENRLGRMLGGNQALAGIGQTAMGNMSGATAGLAGVGQNAMGNLAGATSGLAGVGQTAMSNAAGAAGMIPGLFDATLQPGRTQIQAGQMYDADALARRQAENDLFRRRNDAGWTTLERASGILNGNAGAGGDQPDAPWWQQILGAGAIGSGIYGNIRGSR